MQNFTDKTAEQFYKKFYADIWSHFNSENYDKYYDKSVQAYSEDLTLNYDMLLAHLKNCGERYAYATAKYHKITAPSTNRIKVWMTQTAYTADDKPVMHLETIVTYEIVNDKIKRLWFMWDSPGTDVMEVLK